MRARAACVRTPAPARARPSSAGHAAERQAEQVAAAAVHGRVAWRPVAATGGGAESGGNGAGASGGGQPLGRAVRRRMESHLGWDFSAVRIHRDVAAERLTEAHGAEAMAVGRDLYFARRAYAPESAAGTELLAHELVHVAQQAHSGVRTVQRSPTPNPKTARLTDDQKIEWRKKIRDRGSAMFLDFQEAVDRSPALDKLPPVEAAKLADALKFMDNAVAGANKVVDSRQRAVRMRLLSAVRRLLDDKTWVYLMLIGGVRIVNDSIRKAANPAFVATADQLNGMEREAGIYEAGGESYVFSYLVQSVYREEGVSPEDLKTEERSEEEEGPDSPAAVSGAKPDPAAGAGGKTMSFEDRQMLDELKASLPEATQTGTTSDQSALVEKLKKMTKEQREAFFKFLKTTSPKDVKPDDPSLSMDEMLEKFSKLAAEELEVLETNRDLQDPNSEQKPLTDEVLLEFKTEIEAQANMQKSEKSFDANLARIAQAINDPNAPKTVVDLDLGAFMNEFAMLRGFLAGGASRSDVVKGAAKELTTTIARIRVQAERDLAVLVLESAAMAAISSTGVGALVAGGRLAWLLKRINDIRKFIETVRKAYEIYEHVRQIVELVRGLGDDYRRFKQLYETITEGAAFAKKQIDELSAAPDLDEYLSEKEDELLENFEKLAEGKFGEVLEWFYIPADTTPEELLRIIRDLPRGFDALGAMWDFYRNGKGGGPSFTNVLMVKAFRAGALLSPVVGVFASLVGTALSAIPSAGSFSRWFNDFSGKAKKGPGQKDNAKKRFGSFNRRKYDYDDGEIGRVLDDGERSLRAKLDKDEPEGAWTQGWFRDATRAHVVEMNREFQGRTVTARLKKSRFRGKPAGPPETVPIPPFRVSFPVFAWGDKKLKATLKLNPPREIAVDRLKDSHFARGVAFVGTKPKRERAIRNWLKTVGYEITKTNAGDPHIRLPEGKEESEDRHYLRITSGGRIVHGVDKDVYEQFKERTVAHSKDLPEGYHLNRVTEAGISGIVVQRKRGLASGSAAIVELGLNEKHQLVRGKQKPAPETISKPGVVRPQTESYNYDGPAEIMFPGGKPAAGYDLQDKRKTEWRALIAREPGLRVRPKTVKGELGYVLRARAFGDNLTSRHLPELRHSDNKGHVIGRRFGGEEPYENLIPMTEAVNQWPGAWYKFEEAMAEVYTGKGAIPGDRVTVSMDFSYPNTNTRRPSSFSAEWKAQKKSSGGRKIFRNT